MRYFRTLSDIQEAFDRHWYLIERGWPGAIPTEKATPELMVILRQSFTRIVIDNEHITMQYFH